MTIDGNALYRHPDLAGLARVGDHQDPQERMAQERGVTYVKLDGDVGILGNGAGLVMSTLDVVALAGGRPANFLDAGGGSKADEVVTALEVLLSDDKVKALLVNIFGGITRCDEVAEGLLTALDRLGATLPIVVRLDGTNEEEGRRDHRASARPQNVVVEATMLSAARRARRACEGGGVSILVDAVTRLVVQGITGREGGVPRHPQQGVRHATSSPASRPARPARTSRASRSSTPCGTPSRPPTPTPPWSSCRRGSRPTPSTRPSRAASRLVVCITEGIPAHDMLRVYTHLQARRPDAHRAELPGRHHAPGVATRGHHADPGLHARPGRACVSRSGTLTYQISKELAMLGIGQSTVVGIGGDPVVGSSFIDILAPLRGRPRDRPGRDGRRDRRAPRRRRPRTTSPST